jgi:mono/diheme cytochrome c family protein
MKLLSLRCIGFALLAALMLAPGQAVSQDGVIGKRLATQWCATCHDVAGETTSDTAPGFRILAGDPKRDRTSLRLFLLNPHPPMPQLTLSTQEIDDLVAYILSLAND